MRGRKRAGARMRRPAFALSTVVAAAALVLGACDAGSAPDPPAADLPASSAGPTRVPGAGGPRLTAPPGEPVEVRDFVSVMSRSLDRTTTARVGVEVVSPQVTLAGRGVVDYTGRTPAVRLLLRVPALGEGAIDARLVDEVLYVRMPMLDDSGAFFRVDLRDPANPLGQGPGSLGALDPRAAVRAFGSVVREVRLVGAESRAGSRSRHYWVSADGAALAAVLGGGAGTSLPRRFAFEVWLDHADHVRRLSADLAGRGSLDLRLSRRGAPVAIAAPPATLVEELPAG